MKNPRVHFVENLIQNNSCEFHYQDVTHKHYRWRHCRWKHPARNSVVIHFLQARRSTIWQLNDDGDNRDDSNDYNNKWIKLIFTCSYSIYSYAFIIFYLIFIIAASCITITELIADCVARW